MRLGGKKDEVMVKRFEVCGRWRGRTAGNCTTQGEDEQGPVLAFTQS